MRGVAVAGRGVTAGVGGGVICRGRGVTAGAGGSGLGVVGRGVAGFGVAGGGVIVGVGLGFSGVGGGGVERGRGLGLTTGVAAGVAGGSVFISSRARRNCRFFSSSDSGSASGGGVANCAHTAQALSSASKHGRTIGRERMRTRSDATPRVSRVEGKATEFLP